MSDNQSILGVNVLNIGPAGTGKTTALKTLVKIPGLEIFAIFTEPRYDVLGGEFLDKIHWKYLPPTQTSWLTSIMVAKQVNVLSNDALQKVQNIEGASHRQYIDMLEQCNDFKDQHGKSWGDISTWSTNRVLIIDGLTGISKAARGLGVGGKAILSQPDWGKCMFMVGNFVDALTCNTKCHFILIGHIEREVDEINGGFKNMVSTLGRKLAPMIPVNFGDVILSIKEGKDFWWDTIEAHTDLKNANLPLAAKQVPDYSVLLNNWIAKGGILTA